MHLESTGDLKVEFPNLADKTVLSGRSLDILKSLPPIPILLLFSFAFELIASSDPSMDLTTNSLSKETLDPGLRMLMLFGIRS